VPFILASAPYFVYVRSIALAWPDDDYGTSVCQIEKLIAFQHSVTCHATHFYANVMQYALSE
jgi:hypothetical protein